MNLMELKEKYAVDERLDFMSQQKKRELGLLGNTKKGKEAARKNEERRARNSKVLNDELQYLTRIRNALAEFRIRNSQTPSMKSGRMSKIAAEFNDIYQKIVKLEKKADVAYNTEYAMQNGVGKNQYSKETMAYKRL